jgi:alcohol dehydrogenase class IV
MSFNFSFATASQIIFGNYSLEKVPEMVAQMGKNILLVTGKITEKAQVLSNQFPSGTKVSLFQIESEPTVQMIQEGTEMARSNSCKVVIGLGGGSVIDGAKAIAALATNKGDLMDYLEVIGKGEALTKAPLPSIVIPTTSGTGAEVTKNSVIKSPEHKVKVSLRSDLMYPNVAVVDPILTYSMSPELTASTGVDALTHLLETFVSNQANPFVDMVCREGLQRVSRSLIRAYKNGKDERAREDMAMAGMLGGMALANVKLGAIHGFAGPMGGMFPIPHGEICACLMPAVIQVNIEALTVQNQDIEKFNELAKILTGSNLAQAKDAIVWADNLIEALQIPTLSKFGLSEDDFPELIKKAKVSSSMKGNLVELSDVQLRWILKKSF